MQHNIRCRLLVPSSIQCRRHSMLHARRCGNRLPSPLFSRLSVDTAPQYAALLSAPGLWVLAPLGHTVPNRSASTYDTGLGSPPDSREARAQLATTKGVFMACHGMGASRGDESGLLLWTSAATSSPPCRTPTPHRCTAAPQLYSLPRFGCDAPPCALCSGRFLLAERNTGGASPVCCWSSLPSTPPTPAWLAPCSATKPRKRSA